jgi:hypothetical protein
MAKRGYAFAGLDPSEAMLEYSLETVPVNFARQKIIEGTIVEVINDGKTKIFKTKTDSHFPKRISRAGGEEWKIQICWLV